MRRGRSVLLLLLLSLLQAASGVARSADWPQWRGPTRDGHVGADEPAVQALPRERKPLWTVSIGGGHSSPVVAGGRLLFLDEDGRREVAHLLEAGTGREQWRTPFADRLEDEWGAGPRSTPLIDGDRAYVQSCSGEFRCLNLADGGVLWSLSFEKDYGVKFLGARGPETAVAARRGNNGSAVADGDAVIVPVGSTNGASLVCCDMRTGRVLWTAGREEAAYSSPVVAPLAGVRQVVYLSADSLMGFERASGRLLWRQPLRTFARRHAATPVVFGNRVVVNSHTFGMVCFEIARRADGLAAVEVWRNPDLRVNLATPVFVEGHLYSQGPARDYLCVEATRGEVKWSRTGFGQGRRDYASTLVLGENLLVLTEDGTLVLLAADPERYRELGRLQVSGNTWSHPAYANGRLYVRDGRQLSCLDLGAGP